MSTTNKKDALGKGIRSLLQNIDTDLKNTAGNLRSEVVEQAAVSTRIALNQIEVNPKQPRHDFDEADLNELAASIKMHDIIQPLTVSKLPNGKFRLIAGERRLRASKIAGIKVVNHLPALYKQVHLVNLQFLKLLNAVHQQSA